MIDKILERLEAEKRVLRRAPITFALSLLLGALVSWGAVTWYYSGQVSSLERENKTADEESEFLAIQVREFEDTPCVCKRNGTDESDSFRQGDVFIRPPGKAQTKRVSTATEMHDLLELAAEKRARRLIERSHRIGLGPVETRTAPFDDELEGL